MHEKQAREIGPFRDYIPIRGIAPWAVAFPRLRCYKPDIATRILPEALRRMLIDQYLDAALLGLIEGLTEFIPVSSTGHLIIFDRLLGFEGPPGKVFEVVIQLGAILAICTIYFARLWKVVTGLKDDPGARHFAMAVILAYTLLPLSNQVLWVLGFPLGFFASGYFSGMGAFLTELYPTRLRGSG